MMDRLLDISAMFASFCKKKMNNDVETPFLNSGCWSFGVLCLSGGSYQLDVCLCVFVLTPKMRHITPPLSTAGVCVNSYYCAASQRMYFVQRRSFLLLRDQGRTQIHTTSSVSIDENTRCSPKHSHHTSHQQCNHENTRRRKALMERDLSGQIERNRKSQYQE